MDTVVTEYTEYCLLCGKPAEHAHHLIYGRGLRELADTDQLIIPLCGKCHGHIHTDSISGKLSKMFGQAVWEKHYGDREGFRRRYGRSYL